MSLGKTGIITILLAVITFSCGDKKQEGEVEEVQTVEDVREAEMQASEEDLQMEMNSVAANALAIPELRTFVIALQAAGLETVLREQPGPFTVFAPVNDAFTNVPLDDLIKKENQDKLQKILAYHVINAEVNAVELTRLINENNGTYNIQTSQGATLTASLKDDQVILKDERGNTATVTRKDIEATNGVLHLVDAVLMPKE